MPPASITSAMESPRRYLSTPWNRSLRKTLRNNERCIVALTVGTDGKPTDVHIATSSPASKNEDNGNLSIETRMICVNAAEQYRFKPATFQGKPVAVDLKVEISFKKNP
jgi:hypothetical protein